MRGGVGRKQLFLPLLLAALQLSIYRAAAVRDIHSDHDLIPGELLVDWQAVAALLHLYCIQYSCQGSSTRHNQTLQLMPASISKHATCGCVSFQSSPQVIN